MKFLSPNIDRRIHELIYHFDCTLVDGRDLQCIILICYDMRDYIYARSGEGLLVI
jgi:hypothetical protein